MRLNRFRPLKRFRQNSRVPRPLRDDRYGIHILLTVDGDTEKVATRLSSMLADKFSTVVVGYEDIGNELGQVQAAAIRKGPPGSDITRIVNSLCIGSITGQSVDLDMMEVISTDLPRELISDYPENNLIVIRE